MARSLVLAASFAVANGLVNQGFGILNAFESQIALGQVVNSTSIGMFSVSLDVEALTLTFNGNFTSGLQATGM